MLRNPFEYARPMILPSILSADFARLGNELDDVLRDGGGDFLHLDVMDGHFVPNLSFGPPVLAAVRRHTDAFLDVHLMTTDPATNRVTLADYAAAGADGLTFHVEAQADARTVVGAIRGLRKRVGVSIKPATPASALDSVLEQVDLVLVMSVEPGFSGQSFMPQVLDKCRQIKSRLRPDQRLEIDGGIGPQTIRAAREAGVDWFVAASSIFGQSDRLAAVRRLREAMGE